MSAPHVDRARLADLVGDGITVIAAPPGWGRTTLLQQIAARTGSRLQHSPAGSEAGVEDGLLLIDDADGIADGQRAGWDRPRGLVLVTPATSSARLRADRVIDRADLAFTTGEIADLLRSAGRDNRYRLAARIRAETWGWPALVVAAVAALDGRVPIDESDPDALALGPIRDRFARAAIRGLQEDDEDDLRTLAVLPGWSAGGVRAVLGRRAASTIARLERAGLLVVHGQPRRVAVLRPIRDALRTAEPGLSAELDTALQCVSPSEPEFAALRALAEDWTAVARALKHDFRPSLEGPRDWALSLPGHEGVFRRARAAAHADLGLVESAHRSDEAGGGLRSPPDPPSIAGSFDLTPHLLRAVAVLLSGDVRRALRLLGGSAADQRTATVAELLTAALRAVSSRDGRSMQLEAVAARAEAGGLDRIARLALGAAAATGAGPHERRLLREIVDDCERCGDDVSVALLETFDLFRRSFAGTPARREATALLSRIEPYGSPTATAWIAALLALASTGDPDGPVLVERAERSAAVARSPGPIALAFGARAIVDGDPTRLRGGARRRALETGMLRLPFPDRWRAVRPAPLRLAGVDPEPSVRIRCFGRFAVSLDGVELDLRRMRPQARLLLRILASSPERPVHRDLLLELLSAEDREPASLHALHVHLSSIRSVFRDTAPHILARHGTAYSLATAERSTSDVAEFDASIARARPAIVSADHPPAKRHLRAALDAYQGDLLPEDGGAEWVLALRDRYALKAAEAASTLAELELATGDLDAAVTAATRSCDIAPWRDSSWRLLIDAHQRRGDASAARRARSEYRDVLHSLGV